VEGFCTEAEWRRAYREINGMERNLVNFGAVLLKFWLHIDPDEQLRRFREREGMPHKQWKITEEDWRNREKIDKYREAVEEICTAPTRRMPHGRSSSLTASGTPASRCWRRSAR
jgi:polyphosphate kinase 2 (PPK2 family)